MSHAEPPGSVVALLRGLAGRCPWCGRGGIVTRWFRVADRCPRCGLALEREAGAFLGSMVLSYTLAMVSLALVLGVWVALTAPDIPVLPLTVTGAVIVVAVPVLFFPISKTLWAAIDLLLHRMDRQDRESFGPGDRPP